MPCPAISVIIPLYNAEQFIGECLESVLHQTFQSFEVIVVDDCSTDNSVEIVETYIPKFDGRLRLTKTETNSGGGGEPRNIGLKLAGGKYVLFVDADDFILLTALEILYNAAEEYNADVVYTGAYYRLQDVNDLIVYRDGEGKKLIRSGLEDKPDLRIDDQKGNLSKLLLEEGEGNFSGIWTKLLRRDFLLKNNIIFPKVPLGEDFIWVINVYCHAKRFLRIPTPFYFYVRYNDNSVTRTQRNSAQQISYWVSVFVDFLKSLRALENSNEILSENPAYCLAALKSHFVWCLSCIQDARNELSNQEIYETLYREFAQNPSDSAVPFLFSVIDADKKDNDARQQTIKELKKEATDSKKLTVPKGFPAVSVIIPLYNAEKYIGECLDSLLAQTFQNFEVVVVDDCSTDNSVEIVKRYIHKFNGRLTLASMEKNSGGGALPRNKAITLSSGEYIQCLDADDTLTKTALEEMYTLAKDYDADVVHWEKFYRTDKDGKNIQIKTFLKEPVKVPTLESKNIVDRVEAILRGKFWIYPVDKFTRRKLIIENEIFFPYIQPSEDTIWTWTLVFYAKRFLRVPNTIYIYRATENSVMQTERTSQQMIHFWLAPILFGLKSLDNFMSKHEFFQKNSSKHYELLKLFTDPKFNRTLKNYNRPIRKLKI